MNYYTSSTASSTSGTRPRRTMDERPDGQGPRRLLVATVGKGWDFWAALAVGLAVGLVVGLTDLIDVKSPLLVPAGLACITLATVTVTMEKWVGDHVSASEYGELTGIIDPGHAALLMPYTVVTRVGFVAGVVALVTAGVVPSVTNDLALAVLFGVVGALVAYTAFGFLSLASLTHRHRRRIARLQHLRQRVEAAERERKSRGQS